MMDLKNIRLQMQADAFWADGNLSKARELWEVAAKDAETKGNADLAQLLRERIQFASKKC